jgi:hypothetical protein
VTTYAWTTFIDQSTNANFQQWVNEVYTALVTQCGLTQTADTGQMAVPCVTNAPTAASQQVGYYVFRFNDTLQATSPIFFRLDFGSTPAGALYPAIWITVGSGSNGSGTINGTTMTQYPLFYSNGRLGTSATNYISRCCYVASQGYVSFQFKRGWHPNSQPQNFGMGFVIFRSVGNIGTPTADTTILRLGAGGPSPYTIILDYANARVCVPPNPMGAATPTPLLPTVTLVGTVGQVFPWWQSKTTISTVSPGTYGFTNAGGLGILAELPLDTTITIGIIGTTSLTYISAGTMGGCYYPDANFSSSASYTELMLWQ